MGENIIYVILSSVPKMRDDNAFFGFIWAIAANTYKKYLRKNCNDQIDQEEDIPGSLVSQKEDPSAVADGIFLLMATC